MLIIADLHEIGGLLISGEEIADMRHWLGDRVCTWHDLDQIEELTPEQVVAGVRDHYDGGVRQFLADRDV